MAAVSPNEIREKLIARGMPPHVAEGFLLNFRDESGFDPSVNEREPLVPGSRGGFGLYQLTGPRRIAYEQFAQDRGVNFGDVDAQLDFLMMELEGPERAAARSIMEAPDAGSAAAAIVRNFLRPSPEYRDQRAASYLATPGYDLMVGDDELRTFLSTSGAVETSPRPPARPEGLEGPQEEAKGFFENLPDALQYLQLPDAPDQMSAPASPGINRPRRADTGTRALQRFGLASLA